MVIHWRWYTMVVSRKVCKVERHFTLNGAGDIIRVDRPDGRHTTYEHNAFGRISKARYSDGT